MDLVQQLCLAGIDSDHTTTILLFRDVESTIAIHLDDGETQIYNITRHAFETTKVAARDICRTLNEVTGDEGRSQLLVVLSLPAEVVGGASNSG